MTAAEMRAEALSRARGGLSCANWPAIFEGFLARGIPEAEILPRENVLTYRAWQAVGRQVRRGERGVQVHTWVPIAMACGCEGGCDRCANTGKLAGRRPKSATVFHVTQTDAAEGGAA